MKKRKVEKQQNKGGGADLRVGGEHKRLLTYWPSPPSRSSIPIAGNKRGRRRDASIGSGRAAAQEARRTAEELDSTSRWEEKGRGHLI